MQTLHPNSYIEILIERYTMRNGKILQIREGVLGYGDFLLYDPAGNLKTVVVREVYLNEWSHGHTIRMYNECPKKYQKLIEKMEDSV